MGIKYPDINVTLMGTDGNAFAVLGQVQKALRNGGINKEEQDQFYTEATSGDYHHLLITCMEWVSVE